MSHAYFAIAAAYGLFSVVLGAFELHRIRVTGPDATSVFIAIFVLQCCLPGIGIYAVLPLADLDAPTGNWVFDGIFQHIDLSTALLVLALTVWFVVFFYIGASGGRLMLKRILPQPRGTSFRLEGIQYRFILVLTCGLALTLVSFFLSGDNMIERYANLIRLRAYSDEFERTTLNAYAFELTQTWGWLSIPALFVAAANGRRGLLWFAYLLCAIVFAVLGGSRRALFIPIMLCYFSVLLHDRKWRVGLIVAMMLPIIVWVAYGKEILAMLAFGGTVDDVVTRYESPAGAILRASSEQGITVVESLGTLSFLDEHLRLGVDFLLSIARKFPYALFGIDADLPKRMVRISTEAFASADTQDVPPGLFGQMWLDFRFMGPVVWGLFMGLQVSIAQFMFERWGRSIQSSALVALIVFLVALPVNTGSFDFSISVDVFVTLIALVLVFRERRVMPTSLNDELVQKGLPLG